MYPYIVKTLYEAYKRYAQLQAMIQQGKSHMDYLRFINAGLDNISGLIASLPVKDEKVLEELKNFQQAMNTVQTLYGSVPTGGEAAMLSLHDQTIAESLKVTNAAKEYASGQEGNATRAFELANHMSPKGAERLNAATSAQILHALTQLLKVNGQLLKLQSEAFAMNNKQGKDSARHFNRVSGDVQASLSQFSGDFAFPRF